MANNLISYFPQYIATGAIFTGMVPLGAPWDIEVAREMDIAYLTMYSGVKTPSQFTKLNSVDGVATVESISKLLWAMYGQSWKRLWDGYTIEYSPIDNYKVDETIERTQNDERSITKTVETDSTVDKTQTDTTDMDENTDTTFTHGHVVDATSDEIKNIYGFDTSQGVPSDTVKLTKKETNSGADTTGVSVETTGTISTVAKDTIDTTVTDNTADNISETETTSKKKSGNVGQNSFQELLKQEFDLWRWNFFTQVFNDCDKYLVLSVFDPCSLVN